MLRLVAIGLLLFAVACGSDAPDIAQTGTTQQSDEPETTTTSEPETPTAAPTEVDLTGRDYSYDSVGAVSVPAGALTVKLENAGTEEHQATIVRLNDGVTLADLGAASASDPTGKAALALVTGYGGPNSVAPGGAGTASTVVDEGSYLFICFIPSPSDGVPHAAKGMVLPFEVTPTDAVSADVAGDETITLKDFTFEEPDDFDGQGTFTIENEGPQPHEASVYALEDGATAADVTAFLGGTAPPGPPPFTPAGGISAVSLGNSATVDLDLDAGTYVFICFIPDASTGAPHFTQGMIKEFEIA